MTSEDIKDRYSMADVVAMYGLHPNRSGFVFCPFHNEKGHASLKIYAKDYHCYGCGAHGDIFRFVQDMDGCGFRDAFLKLGGAYQETSDWKRRKFEYSRQKRKEREEKRNKCVAEEKKRIYDDIKHHRLITQYAEVFSDAWCESTEALERLFRRLEEMEKEENGNH